MQIISHMAGLGALLLAVSGGCGDKVDDSPQPGSSGSGATATTKTTTSASSAPAKDAAGTVVAGGETPIDVAAVNALVPASLKKKITFEQIDAVEDLAGEKFVFTVAGPKGWVPALKGQALLKSESDAFGFTTRFWLGTSCGGPCGEPKDWNAVIDETYKPFIAGKVIKDEKRKGGRTLVAEEGDKTAVVIGVWKEGASRYFHCGATLDKDAKELVAAIVKACAAFTVKKG